ncbi:MAG: lipopolysaccharide biosynthesis protein [Anaerolineaceae bacterium]
MIKRAFISSYVAQGYISLLGIVFMPVYLHYMGPEAFGLVGFFLMMQAWLQLLDLGLSPTLSREMSLYRAGVLDVAAAWQRLRSMECLLGLLALVALAALLILQDRIATEWLSFHHLSAHEVARCIAAMAITVALRWLMGLYRAGLIGLELQMWVIWAGALFATMKFVGVVVLLKYWSSAPLTFFGYQALVGAFEFLVFALAMYRALASAPTSRFPTWNALRLMLPVAGAMAFLSGVWVFMTQIDKLILSRLLPLKEYGYFTLAVVVAGGVLMLVPPLNQVLQPRMTILVSQGQNDALSQLYRQATQIVSAVFFALGLTLALFAEPVLFAWTGNTLAAQAAAPILFWYGLANALIGLLVLPFMLQFAHGYLRLHVIGNVIMGIILLPSMVYAAVSFGGVGAGATLLIANLLFLILWVPRVHRRLLPDLVWIWPLRDVGLVAVPIVGFLVTAHWLIPPMANRFLALSMIGLVFLAALFVGLMACERSWGLGKRWVGSRL